MSKKDKRIYIILISTAIVFFLIIISDAPFIINNLPYFTIAGAIVIITEFIMVRKHIKQMYKKEE